MSKTHPLKIFQVAHGLSTDQLSKKFGKSEQAMYSWLSGKTHATMKDLSSLTVHYTRDEVNKLARDWLDWIGDNCRA